MTFGTPNVRSLSNDQMSDHNAQAAELYWP